MASIAETPSHVADERGWLVASPDGSHAAVVEPGRIVIVELRRGAQVAEIGAAAAGLASGGGPGEPDPGVVNLRCLRPDCDPRYGTVAVAVTTDRT